MEQNRIDDAAAAAGIGASYISATGEPMTISRHTKERLLSAMGKLDADASTSKELLPPVAVFRAGDEITLTLQFDGQPLDECTWRLTPEQGKVVHGGIGSDNRIVLPATLPMGYHQLAVLRKRKVLAECRVIVTPQRCFEPELIRNGGKLWGTSVQLYTLRSERNWGIGDFGDLQEFLREFARRGGSFVGLNPIHALYPANPEGASPYSPSSRRWLNILYIDVNAVEDFQHSAEAQAWWHSAEIQQMAGELRATDWVDYSRVTNLKVLGLQLAFKTFAALPSDDARVAAFEAFRQAGGESLEQQATFDALHAWLKSRDPHAWGWPAWPEQYREWSLPAVGQFREDHADDVRFYAWLQWLASTQLAQCQALTQELGMALGIYRDLAVGVTEGGTETWSDRTLYVQDASVGAPPDILGPQGQNWGLPPMDPNVMVERGYQPFIDLLQANMSSCGALRIDHVMALLRLWWVPRGESAKQGAYVSYPIDDLLGVLALESQRHQCMVIGEDLGTVPVEIVSKLRGAGVYSYKVFYFEQKPEGGFMSPRDYPVQAMATLSIHDLPTIRGYWLCHDFELGREVGIYPDEEVLKRLYEQRMHYKQWILDSLHAHHSIPAWMGRDAAVMGMSAELSEGMQVHMASTSSALLCLQPEDWLEMEKPVNIPGTSDQYPNWRRKLSCNTAEMFQRENVNRLLAAIDQRRKQQ